MNQVRRVCGGLRKEFKSPLPILDTTLKGEANTVFHLAHRDNIKGCDISQHSKLRKVTHNRIFGLTAGVTEYSGWVSTRVGVATCRDPTRRDSELHLSVVSLDEGEPSLFRPLKSKWTGDSTLVSLVPPTPRIILKNRLDVFTTLPHYLLAMFRS
ncbi:hypothetical protein J6590_079085 [Homalodisca vitripennis]|nr:hypothetical protein J6590_079085 [Homalodisca vitripennis]